VVVSIIHRRIAKIEFTKQTRLDTIYNRQFCFCHELPTLEISRAFPSQNCNDELRSHVPHRPTCHRTSSWQRGCLPPTRWIFGVQILLD
jgi:hypothetical protein